MIQDEAKNLTQSNRGTEQQRILKLSSQSSVLSPLLIVFILLLAAALRFHLLGAQSFWNDEGNSYVQATRSFADIAANAARDIHPPGYYWLLAAWRSVAGDSEFA